MAQLDNKIQVAIYSPNGLVYDHKSLGCNMQTDDGGLSILPNHVPIMLSLAIGAVIVTRTDGAKDYIAVDGGVASFEENKLTIMATFAIRARDIDTVQVEIDKQNAQAAMYDAEQKDDSSAYRRAKVQLNRAINQIDVSRHRRPKN
ncbi:ATP synthase F1 subunit epsilon [Aerococcaceae bacterium DSM 111022]|nr:ATP synthase F1 subunit epsilon [Aerococcaceae bacterium DSM 111022]MBG9989187.1 ATP synthase F1 subunit epsilon [Aerococcaceae bacterium DSM 111176]